MRITKVYTRTGDAGKTRLAGGQQVWKDSLRVEAYGTVDELNSAIGVVRVFNADRGNSASRGQESIMADSGRAGATDAKGGRVDQGNGASRRAKGGRVESMRSYVHAARLEEDLRWVQNKLFDAGGILATAPGQTFKNMPQVTAQDVSRLERMIDACQKDLAPLKEFILPGGGKISGLLHQARTVCRRAERICVKLSHEDPVDPVIVKFLNRLSDALFVWARWVSKTQGEPEFLWQRDVGTLE